MRVLVLSPYVPYPVLHGGHERTLGLLRCLSRFASVEVLAIGDSRVVDQGARDHLSGLGISLAVFPATGPGPPETRADDVTRLPDAMCHFRSPALSEALERRMLEDPPDVTHFEELVMAQYLDRAWTARVIDRQRVEFLYHEAMAARPTSRALHHRKEADRFRRCEAALAGRFERVLVVGEADAQALNPVWGRGRTRVVPISIGDSIRRPDGRSDAIDHVLLHGALDDRVNVEALGLYFREVWPVLRRDSGLRTVVIGSGGLPVALGGADDRVELCGSGLDVSAELTKAGVLLIPLRAGAVASTRIREALAAGMPVVSTGIGVENLGLKAGWQYLRAETPDEMAATVLRLARDPALVTELSRNGAWSVDVGFRDEILVSRIEGVFREALRGCPRGRRLRGRLAYLHRSWPPATEAWLRRRLSRHGLAFEALRALKRAAMRLLDAIRAGRRRRRGP